MSKQSAGLTRRERQIMDILYRLKSATAAEVLAEMPDQTNYSTIRAQLRGLEEKGHVQHTEKELRYLYTPKTSHEEAKRSALRHLIHTFFEGSTELAVAALVGGNAKKLSPAELERLSKMIEDAVERTKIKNRKEQ